MFKRTNKTLRFVGLLMVFAMLLPLVVGVVSAQDEPVVLNYSFGPGDIPSLDPALATDTSSIQVIIEVFPGLTRLHEETLELLPGVATWETSEDGLTYTFNIVEGIPWVHYNAETGAVEEVTDDEGNVRYLTAHDFVYGWQRTLDPNTAGDYAYVLAPWVANGSEVNAGEVGLEELGVTAVDDLTFQVTATDIAPFVPNIFGMWMASAQPQWAIEEHGDAWTEAENIATYGPFALKEWLHDESITMIKNPFWAGTESMPVPQIDEIYSTMLDASAQLANFEAGTLDISQVPLADIDRIKSDATLSQALYVGPDSCTYYYGFNVAKPPLDDARVRRALSMSIDRQAIIDNILKGEQQPAFFFSRPNTVAAPTHDLYPEYVIGEDVAVAQGLLQEYLDETGQTLETMPPITLMHNESEAHAVLAQAVQQMWAENLGVNVQIQTQEWAVYLETLREDTPQIYRLGWCFDYPDASNFLFDVWHTSTNPRGNWSNAEYDALVDEARTLQDVEARRELYAQAENIISNTEAGLINVYYYTSLSLTQPWVNRTYSQLGNQYFEKWSIGDRP